MPDENEGRRSRALTSYRIMFWTIDGGWDVMRGSDGDKPLRVEARTPEGAIEVVDDDLRADHAQKAVAIPQSSWHEFMPRASWAKL